MEASDQARLSNSPVAVCALGVAAASPPAAQPGSDEELGSAVAVQSPAEVLVAGLDAADDGEPSLCVTMKRKARPLSALRARATAEAFLRAVLVPEDRPHIWLRMRVEGGSRECTNSRRAQKAFETTSGHFETTSARRPCAAPRRRFAVFGGRYLSYRPPPRWCRELRLCLARLRL